MPRERQNVVERRFEKLAEANGWRSTKRGWPDFICFRPDGSVFVVECKPRMNPNGWRKSDELRILSKPQAEVLDFLSELGVECFVSDGKELEPYEREKHAPEERRYH